jgi:hypothetical protein
VAKNRARQLLQEIIEAEVRELLAAAAERQMTDRKIGVVRNVRLLVWELQTGLGLATIQIPEVRAKSGDFLLFLGTTIGEKTRSLEATLLWLYLAEIYPQNPQ